MASDRRGRAPPRANAGKAAEAAFSVCGGSVIASAIGP